MKKVSITVFLTAVLIAALSLCASAQELVITDFDSLPDCELEFLPGNAVSELNIVNDLVDFANHGKILSVQTENTDSSVVRTLSISAKDASLNLSAYKSLCLSVYIEPINQTISSCFVRTMLTGTNGELFESISSIESGKWVDISIDISAYMGRGEISDIEIGIIPDHIDSGLWNGSFAIDSLYANEPVNNTLASRFCFESFNAIGLNTSLSPDYSKLTIDFEVDSSEHYIEFPIALVPSSFSNAIRINLENDTDAESMTLVLLKEENVAPVRITKQIKSHADPCIYEIDISKPLSIKALRIEFPKAKGSAIFRSIEFTSTYNNSPYITYGSITGCTANDDGLISISGELEREYVTEFAGTELYLYSLDLSDDPRKFDYAGTAPLARHGISTKFRFTVDGVPNEDFRFKKYVVMISTSPMVFVDTPIYVSEHPLQDTSNGFKAGVSLDNAYQTSESLSRATVIDIKLDELISLERNGYMHTLNGKQYYFEKLTVDKLDRELGAYAATGLSAFLRISDSDLPFPDIKTPESYENMRAAIEFLAKRYATQEHSAVDGIIIGSAVNTGSRMLSAVSMTDYVNSYVQLMRLVHQACANAGAGVRVYASLGDVFEYERFEGAHNRFDTDDFLFAIGDYIADEGEFPWGICIEAESGKDAAGKILSLDTPDELYELFAMISIKESLKNKPIIVNDHIDFTCPDDDFARAVATRACFAAGTGEISRYIVSPEKKSPHTSQVCAAIKALNSGDRILLEGIGASIRSYDRLLDTKKLETVKLNYADVSTELDPAPVGSYTYLDFNSYDQLDNLLLSHNANKIKLVPMQTGTLAMRAEFSKDLKDAPMACAIVTKDFDFHSTPVLSLDLIASDIDKDIELTLRFIGENSVSLAKASLSPDTRKRIYVKLSEQEQINKIELSVSTDVDKVTLYADELIGYSHEYDSKRLYELANKKSGNTDSVRSLNPTVVTVFLLIIIVLLSLVIILSVNSRKNDNSEKRN